MVSVDEIPIQLDCAAEPKNFYDEIYTQKQIVIKDKNSFSSQDLAVQVMGDKPCTMCGTARSVLVRCQIDDTGKWHFVCPGKCWHSVSGGIEDAKGHESEFPHYKYGGMVCLSHRALQRELQC